MGNGAFSGLEDLTGDFKFVAEEGVEDLELGEEGLEAVF